MNGDIVPLSPKAFDTLQLLVEGEGRIVSKQEFMAALWPDSFVEDSNLTQNIFVLRKVLGVSPEGRAYIETIPKRGYRFSGVLRREESSSSLRQEEITEAELSIAPAVEVNEGLSGGLEPVIPGQVQLPPPLPVARQWTRHWGLIVVVAVLVLGLLGIFVAHLWEPHTRVGGYVRLTNDGSSKDLRTTASIAATDGKNVYFTEVKGNHSILARVPAEGGEITYDAPSPRGDHVIGLQPDGRGLLTVTNWQTNSQQPLLSRDLSTGVSSPVFNLEAQDASWSADGKSLAYTQSGRLFVRSVDGSTTVVSTVKGLAYWPRWSPDGRVIRFTQNYDGFHDRLWEVDIDGSNLHELFTDRSDSDHLCCGTWTKSGRGFVYLSVAPNNNSIHVRAEDKSFWNRSGEESIDIPAAPLDRWISPIPSLDGKHVFAIGEQLHGQLVRIDPVTRRPEPMIGGLSAEGVDFSPDRKEIVWTAYPEGTLWRSRSDGSGRTQLTQAPLVARFPRWSPDGTTIVFTAAQPGSDWKVYSVPAKGGEIKVLLHESAGQGVATWSPDGKLLTFGHLLNGAKEQSDPFDVQILRLADGQASHVAGSEGLWSPRWSPDGRFISALTIDNRILRLYDVQNKTWIDLAHGDINDVVWSPDSKSLFFDTNIGADALLYRVQLSDRTTEVWTDLRELRRAGFFGAWLGMAPDGAPLLLEDASIQELYSVAVTLP